MKIDIDKVKEHLEYLNKDNGYEFYVALMIYERLALAPTEITQRLIQETHDCINSYESIYNDDLRGDIDNLLKEQENEKELEDQEKAKELEEELENEKE